MHIHCLLKPWHSMQRCTPTLPMPSQPTCRYKKLWDQDKDAYIRRYEKANKPLSSYELDIKEYLNKEVCASTACHF